MGLEAGIRGFVCSPQEVAALRTLTGPEGVLVIPAYAPLEPQSEIKSASPLRRKPCARGPVTWSWTAHHPGAGPG